MKTKNIFKALALAMLMPAMLLTTACSNQDDVVNNNIANLETVSNKGYALPVTVNVTREGDKGSNRAAYTDNGDGTGSLGFSAGDKLFVEGRDNDGAEYFAGVLDYVPATGKFSGTIYTQNEWLGTADELFVAANADQTLYNPTFIATLLPAGYEDYGYLGINDKGDAYAYNDRVKDNINYTLATDKSAGVEQLSWERATVYDNGFALEPRNAILNFTVTGLEANTDVDVLVRRSTTWYIGTKTIRTDNDGKVTFVACYPYGNNLQDCTVTVGGSAITVVSSAKNVERGKIYNITRAKPIVVTWNTSNWGNTTYSKSSPLTLENITLSMSNDARFKTRSNSAEFQCYMMESGNYTFTAPTGKKFTKIEISCEDYWNQTTLGSGWSKSEPWEGTASSTVKMFNDDSNFDSDNTEINSITFYIE